MLLAELADRPGVERVEVVDHLLAQGERRPDRDGEAERVEERQDAQQDLSGLSCTCCSIWCALLRTLRCERTTPLGSPVEPEVKITVASSSSRSPRRPGTNAPRARSGRAWPRRPPRACRRGVTCLGMSSSRISVPFGTILNLSRTLAEVMHVGDPALVDRGIDDLLAGGVIEVDGDLAPERDGEIGHGRRDDRRDQQADVGGHRPRFAPGRVPWPGRGGTCRRKSMAAPVLSLMAVTRDGFAAPIARTLPAATATPRVTAITRARADGPGSWPDTTRIRRDRTHGNRS